MTVDVSRGGVFLWSEEPRSQRQLLRLRITFDSAAEPIEVHGMVVHCTTPAESASSGGPPGMGIEFIAFGGTPRERWERFLRQISNISHDSSGVAAPIIAGPSNSSTLAANSTFEGPTSTPQPQHHKGHEQPQASPYPQHQAQQQAQRDWNEQTPAHHPYHSGQQRQADWTQQQAQRPQQQADGQQQQAQWPQQQQRQWPQHHQQTPARQRQRSSSPHRAIVTTVFPIPVETPEQLYEIYERDLVAGVMFVCTRERLGIGDRVTLRILHPNGREQFDLHGKVQQIHDNPQYPGLNVVLRPSTIRKREKFREFIEIS